MAALTPIVYTRQNCPLCEKAKAVLVAEGVQPEEVDVDLDLELMRKFTNDVPVIYVDGAEVARHHITAEQVRAIKSGWRVVGGRLQRDFAFPDFMTALAFVNRIGAIAEKHNHHPDVLLKWGSVRVMTWSHDVNAITDRDWRLASALDQAATA